MVMNLQKKNQLPRTVRKFQVQKQLMEAKCFQSLEINNKYNKLQLQHSPKLSFYAFNICSF